MTTETDEKLQNTHDTLRLFYTVLLTLGISQGLLKFVNSPDGVIRPITSFALEEILVLGIFLLFMGRFFLGGVRHLDATYIERPLTELPGNVKWFVGLDMALLATDALLLLYIGSAIRELQQFFAATAFLLLVDSVWGLGMTYIYDAVRIEGEFSPEFKWSINNFIHFLLIAYLFVVFDVLSISLPISQISLLIIFGYSNSIFDFILTWDFYFPY